MCGYAVIGIRLELSVFHRGEYGMGTMANELTLGCDCLGKIHYLVGGMPNFALESSHMDRFSLERTLHTTELLSW